MKTSAMAVLSSLVIMVVLDATWLSIMSKRFYTPHLNHLMSENLNFVPVIFFYLLYALGVAYFVVTPAVHTGLSLFHVFCRGAFFGLVAYAAYDMTNQATLKDWPLLVSIVDLAWGALATGVVATISVFATQFFVQKF